MFEIAPIISVSRPFVIVKPTHDPSPNPMTARIIALAWGLVPGIGDLWVSGHPELIERFDSPFAALIFLAQSATATDWAKTNNATLIEAGEWTAQNMEVIIGVCCDLVHADGFPEGTTFPYTQEQMQSAFSKWLMGEWMAKPEGVAAPDAAERTISDAATG